MGSEMCIRDRGDAIPPHVGMGRQEGRDELPPVRQPLLSRDFEILVAVLVARRVEVFVLDERGASVGGSVVVVGNRATVVRRTADAIWSRIDVRDRDAVGVGWAKDIDVLVAVDFPPVDVTDPGGEIRRDLAFQGGSDFVRLGLLQVRVRDGRRRPG